MLKYTKEYILEWLDKDYGFEYVDGEIKGIKSKIICKDKEGYYYYCILQKMKHRGHKPKKVHSSNPYSLYNINLYLKKYTNNEFECISKEYHNNEQYLEFKHLVCGRIIKNKWINIGRGRYLESLSENKTGLFCNHCNTKQLESTHALVLKQVWLHEHSDTIVEDKSCINPNTHMPMPTDIVNHRLKIAIEIQSWFHDFEDQKAKDLIKKNYWISCGYDFYAIDQRDYTVLEMINIFFPDIYEIPKYIDFDFSNKFNDVEAQRLLNTHKSVLKVAEILKCSPHRIYDSIYNKRIEYPKDYIYNNFRQVVQLDMNLDYMNTYTNISSAEKNTGANGISGVLNSGRNYCGGYYWLYEDIYRTGVFSITLTKLKK